MDTESDKALETLSMKAIFSTDKSIHEVHGIVLVDTTTFFVRDCRHHGFLNSLGGRVFNSSLDSKVKPVNDVETPMSNLPREYPLPVRNNTHGFEASR